MTDLWDFDLVEERREYSEQLAYEAWISTTPEDDFWALDEEEER